MSAPDEGIVVGGALYSFPRTRHFSLPLRRALATHLTYATLARGSSLTSASARICGSHTSKQPTAKHANLSRMRTLIVMHVSTTAGTNSANHHLLDAQLLCQGRHPCCTTTLAALMRTSGTDYDQM